MILSTRQANDRLVPLSSLEHIIVMYNTPFEVRMRSVNLYYTNTIQSDDIKQWMHDNEIDARNIIISYPTSGTPFASYKLDEI